MPARMIIALLLVLLIPTPAIAQDINSQLVEAAKNGDTVSIKSLLEAGADLNAWDRVYETTALGWAAAEGHMETAQALLDAGANVNAKGEDGYTALMYAANAGHTEIVEMLKKAGAKE